MKVSLIIDETIWFNPIQFDSILRLHNLIIIINIIIIIVDDDRGRPATRLDVVDVN